MTKRLNTSKGITLIALVITIIVLLILAGVAIAMLSGENGILKKAAEAKTKTEQAQTNETEHLESYEDIINEKIDGTKTVKSYKGKIITGNNATLIDKNKETVVVPAGFKIKEDSPTEVKKGIVVVAPDNSEFVWVPVKDVSKMYGTNAEGKKLGKLYNFTSGGYTALNWTETNGVMSFTNEEGNREPAILSENKKYAKREDRRTEVKLSSNTIQYKYKAYSGKLKAPDIGDMPNYYPDDTFFNTDNKINEFLNDIKEEYDNMTNSVEKNKGFYVGRYETSLNETSKNAQSISGVNSATAAEDSANTWYGLYQKEKEYTGQDKLKNVVGSSMIWGSQYDQMMIWMQGNGIDVTSTTPTNLEGVTTIKNTTRKTGTVSTDKLNNIYDLLGNSLEWTLEANYTSNRTNRGGNSYRSYSPRSRSNCDPYDTDSSFSTRLTLYIK